MTYDIGNRVMVKALGKRGKILTVSETPSGKYLLGIVLDDDERALRHKKGGVDVYAGPDQLDHFDSTVTVEDHGGESMEGFEDLVDGFQDDSSLIEEE